MQQWLLAILLMVPVQAWSQSWKPNERTKKLSINGYDLYFIATDNPHDTHFRAILPVGGFEDASSRPGISHFLEHMLTTGSEQYPASSLPFRTLGAIGTANAYTNASSTVYHWTGHYQVLAKSSGMYANLLTAPEFSEEAFATEKSAILNESDSSIGSPDGFAQYFALRKLLYGDSALSTNIIASRPDVDAIRIEEVRSYWRQHYSRLKFIVAAPFHLYEHLYADTLQQLSAHIKPHPGAISGHLRHRKFEFDEDVARTDGAIHMRSHTQSFDVGLNVVIPLKYVSYENVNQLRFVEEFFTTSLYNQALVRIQNRSMITSFSANFANEDGQPILILGLSGSRSLLGNPEAVKEIFAYVSNTIKTLTHDKLPQKLIDLYRMTAARKQRETLESPNSIAESITDLHGNMHFDMDRVISDIEQSPSFSSQDLSAYLKDALDIENLQLIYSDHADAKLAKPVPTYPFFDFEHTSQISKKALIDALKSEDFLNVVANEDQLPDVSALQVIKAEATLENLRLDQEYLGQPGNQISILGTSYKPDAAYALTLQRPLTHHEDGLILEILLDCFSFDQALLHERASILHSHTYSRALDLGMLEIRLGVKGDPVASKAYFREYLRELKRYTPKLTTLHTVITHYMSHYERANYGFPYERAEVYGSHLLSHHINSPSLIRERLLKWTTPEIMIRMNELKAKFFRAADLSISAAGQGVDPQTIQTDVRDLIPRTLTHFERGLRPKLLKTEMIQEPLFVALEQAEANTQGNGVSVAFNYLLQDLDVHSEVRLGVLKSFFANLLHTELRERLHLGYAHVFRANMTAHTKTWILQAISQTDRPQDLGLITETWNMMLAALKKGFTNDQEDLIRSLIRSQRMSAREYNGDNFELAYANLKSLSIHGISWPEYIAIHQEALRSEDPAEYTSLIRRVFGESKPVLKIVTGLKFEETPKVVSDDCAKVFEHSRDAAEYLRRIMGR